MYHGEEIQPSADANGGVSLSFNIEGGGYGAVLATGHDPSANLTAFLATMKEMSAKPLAAYDGTWRFLPQTMDMPKTPVESRAAAPPTGMVEVPGGVYSFVSSGVEIEGGNGPSTTTSTSEDTHVGNVGVGIKASTSR